jgi:hypothetical protein
MTVAAREASSFSRDVTIRRPDGEFCKWERLNGTPRGGLGASRYGGRQSEGKA